MPQNYKTPNGAVHQLEDTSFEHLLPPGCVKITQAQADAILHPAPTFEQVVIAKVAELEKAYAAVIQMPVAYMAATFQADESSQSILTKCLVAGSVPAGFYWLDATNAPVPMTFEQLQGLAGVMLAQGQAAFVTLQTRKAAVRAAGTAADVDLVVW